MRGLTNQCGVGRGAANGLPGLYRQKSADRTSEYCDVGRSTRRTLVDTTRETSFRSEASMSCKVRAMSIPKARMPPGVHRGEFVSLSMEEMRVAYVTFVNALRGGHPRIQLFRPSMWTRTRARPSRCRTRRPIGLGMRPARCSKMKPSG